MKEIVLTRGKVAIVDDDDFERLNQFKWCFDNVYAKRGVYIPETQGTKTLRMHNDILTAPKGMVVDHINLNKLDNRKENLRVVSRQYNNIHRAKGCRNKTGFVGVQYIPHLKLKKWTAEIRMNGKRFYLGYFHTAIEAAREYNKHALKHFGEYAVLNQIPSGAK